MRKLIVFAVAILMTVAVQAQDKKVKNTYVENGTLIEATLRYDSGKISQTGFYTKEGALTGEWISYDRQGNKTAAAQYENGEKVGTWFFWTDDKLTEVTYKDSRVAVINTWKNQETRVVSNK